MGYLKQTWIKSPTWVKTATATALVWSSFVGLGNGLVAYRELSKDYTPAQAEQNIRGRLGQFYPYYWDKFTFTVGTPARKLVYKAYKNTDNSSP